MKTVVLDGVEYTKASVVAEKFKYTSDYIGQLCRAKKIDARLVGRTWFVNEDSLVEHKKTKHQKTSSAPMKKESPVRSETAEKTSDTKTYRVPVNAPLKNKTVKSLSEKPIKVTASGAKEAVQIRYERDSEHLFPTVVKKSNADTGPSTVKKYLHIEPASAKKLKIKTRKRKPLTFKTTKLPDIALSGKLDISTYPAPESEEEAVATPSEPKKVDPAVEKPAPEPEKPQTDIKQPTPAVPDEVQQKVPDQTAILVERKMSTLVRISPLLGTVLAAAVSFLLLSLSAEVFVSDVLATSTFTFYLEKFAELLTR